MCNKCGLFERTHSRPRPEQFPHKRGPLATSTLRGRTPPSNQLPPISPPANSYYGHPSVASLQDPRRDVGPGQQSSSQQYPSSNGAPGSNHHLPALQTWHSNTNSASAPSGGSGGANNNSSAGQAGNGNATDSSAPGGSPHMPPPPSRKPTGDSQQSHSQSQSRQASPSPHLRAQNIQDSNAREQGVGENVA